MALKLMYITNRPDVAIVAEKYGVDRIFIDMEYIGKDLRQGGLNTVQNHHTLEDVKNIRKVLTKSELLVRCNPIHEKTKDYGSSKDEIDGAIENGADIIMLPFFKTVEEVKEFINIVDGRVKTMLLVETPEAVELIDEILKIKGIDEIHIGLNDLSLGYKMKFMFQLVADGTVEYLCNKIKQKNIPYGFGGIAKLGGGLIPAEMVITEHYKLGSSMAILSRSFCNTSEITDINEIGEVFKSGMRDIRNFENNVYNFEDNHKKLCKIVKEIVEK